MLFREDVPALFIAGYGTGRRVEAGSTFDEGRRHQRYTARFQRVASLFLDEFELVPLSAWFHKSGREAELRELFDALVPELELTDEVTEGDLVLQFRGVPLPFAALSDGDRSFVGWVGDLLYRLHGICPADRPIDTLPGVVLVDELDLHLHPEWQREVVGRLSSALPRLQFVCTGTTDRYRRPRAPRCPPATTNHPINVATVSP